jgi:curved DNA-binding protein
MDYKDYYKTLGIARTATQAEIKKAYRRQARLSHPDVKPGDSAAEQRFKDVNEANEVLSDPAKRKQYDELGANWEAYSRAGAGTPDGASPFGPGGPYAGFAGFGGQGGQAGNIRYEFRTSGAGGEQFSDFFRMFFGGDAGVAEAGTRAGTAGGGGRRGGRGHRAQAAAGPSIEDLLSGVGGGFSGAGGGFEEAGAMSRPLPPAEAQAQITLEEAFHGTTRLVDVDGRRLEVKVPPGMDTGSRIRLRGKGGGEGSAARDLYISARVEPHAVFTRTGADLTREVRVTLREALLGAEIPVRTLKGRVLLTIPAGTQNGRTFRLSGQGMPRLKGEGKGDLYVRVAVVLPAALGDEAREAAGHFLDLADQPDPRGGS